MDQKRYVAYVGTYTHGSSKGIHIYDLDVENGRANERKVVPITLLILRNHITESICIQSQMRAFSLLKSFRTAIWSL